jgi:hypothetical protein
MTSELPGPPESGRAEFEEHELDINHAAIRRAGKNLLKEIQHSSPHLVNRQRVLQLVEELLILVPARNQDFEERDEHARAVERGDIEPFADLGDDE